MRRTAIKIKVHWNNSWNERWTCPIFSFILTVFNWGISLKECSRGTKYCSHWRWAALWRCWPCHCAGQHHNQCIVMCCCAPHSQHAHAHQPRAAGPGGAASRGSSGHPAQCVGDPPSGHTTHPGEVHCLNADIFSLQIFLTNNLNYFSQIL